MTLLQIQKKVESITGEKFSSFPGNKKRGNIFYPTRQNHLDSERFFLAFMRGEKEDYVVFRDFADDKKYRFPLTGSTEHFAKTLPSSKSFKKNRALFKIKIKNLKLKQGFNSYIKEFNDLTSICGVKDDILFVPFFKDNTLKAVLKISSKGAKKFVYGSEPSGAFCPLRYFPNKGSLVYLCEGIRTGYACLKACPESSGVLVVGSFSNMQSVISYVLSKEQIPILCAEKSQYDQYVVLKEKNKNCHLVGSKSHDDLYHLYKDLGFDILKKNITTFKEDTFIPLGLDEKSRVVCYIKNLKNVISYKKAEKDELFADAFNLKNPSSVTGITPFFWKTRFYCRQAGIIKYYQKIKEGVFPFRSNIYYHDTVRLYIVRDKIEKIDPEAIISSECVLCKEKNLNLPDLTELNPLSDSELDNMFSYLNLFNFNELDLKLIKGWIIQSILAGGLQYRTPIWIVAPTGTGKTQFTSRLLKNFFIFYERKTGRQTTPKWIHRNFNGKAIPLQRDEYDPSRRHAGNTEDEMECVRTTTTERFPERGISAGIDDTVQSFSYCFSALYSSTRKPLELSKPDLARFIFLGLSKGMPKNYNKKMHDFKNLMTLENKSRLVKTCLLRLKDTAKLYEFYMTNSGFSHAGHKKSSLFMLAACHNTFFKDKIKLKDLIPSLQKVKPSLSRLLIDCLKLTLKKIEHDVLQSDSIFNCLQQKQTLPYMNRRGFFLRNNKKFLLIHEKRGIMFLQRVFKEHAGHYSEDVLMSELENDGPYFLKRITIGKLKKDPEILRGKYLVFNFEKIKEDIDL